MPAKVDARPAEESRPAPAHRADGGANRAADSAARAAAGYRAIEAAVRGADRGPARTIGTVAPGADAADAAGAAGSAGSAGNGGNGGAAGTAGTTAAGEPLPAFAPRVDLRGLVDAIVSRARGGNGRVELRFALTPEDLGTVRVHMESAGDRLTIRILAATQAAHDAIARDLPRLVEALRGPGSPAPDVEVEVDAGTERGADPRSGAGGHDRQGEAGAERGARRTHGAHDADGRDAAAISDARSAATRRAADAGASAPGRPGDPRLDRVA